MKQSLQLRLGQQLSMTPQLQQAIKLLQLSSLDLQLEIQQAIESNPLLEVEETQVEPDATPDKSEQVTGENPDTEYDQFQQSGSTESEWTPTENYPTSSNYSGDDRPSDYPATSESLHEHLHSQISTLQLSDDDYLIAQSIIDAIDDDGYLTISIDDIASTLPDTLEIEQEEISAVLNLVQHLDPSGVGARDLQECLHLQLQQLPDNPNRLLAREIVEQHFNELSHKDFAQIGKSLNRSSEDIQQAVQCIQSLSPRPGGQISSTPTEYITPDVLVRKIKGEWRVILNGEIAPQLKVNNYYASMIRRADDSRDNVFLKNNLQEARWFLKSLKNRNDTLLKVATLIVEQQQEFLEHGEERMKPMVLRDIAEAIEMHESTISRVTTQKYMHTPRGIFELKYFFSSHVNTANGGECSSTAIRAMIKKLVTSEDDRKPLSDNKLAQLLEQRGIKVARRTVAKYRESLMIPPSNERRLRA